MGRIKELLHLVYDAIKKFLRSQKKYEGHKIGQIHLVSNFVVYQNWNIHEVFKGYYSV